MSVPHFEPEIDSFRWQVESPPPPALADAWRDAADAALRRLQSEYGPAVEYHDVPRRMRDFSDSAEAMALAVQAGVALAALDYFQSRTPLPRRRGESIEAHIWNRSLQTLRQDGASLLVALAHRRWLPEDWIPREMIAKQIRSRLSLLEVSKHCEIEMRLRMPKPAGAAWLTEHASPRISIDQPYALLGDALAVVACDAAPPCVALAYRVVVPPAPFSLRVLRAIRCGDLWWRLRRRWYRMSHR